MKQLFTFLLAAMAFVACTQNEVEELSANRADVPETLTVGFEGGDTRVELNDALKTVWTEGDEVSVFYRSNANQRWAFQGETGDRIGTLKRVANAEATAQMTNIVVVYPYNTNYWLNYANGNIEASLPAVQSYKDGSYGKEGNIMVAESDYRQFTLKSVVGWLRVELTGEGESVKSITLRGNAGEQVAGELYIDTATAEATLATEIGEASDEEQVGGVGGGLEFDDTIFREVTLNCGEGVMLDSEAKSFYIGLLPQTFEQGITVEVECGNGTSTTKSTADKLVVERNHIVPMASFKYDGVLPDVYELAYTTNDGKPLDPYTTEGFGGEFMENIYDATTGRGVLKFAGAITTIPEQAFGLCENLTWIDIPEGITTIGTSAFTGCSALEEITIPASVTDVGNEAFKNCPCKATINCDNASFEGAGFTEIIIGDNVTTIGGSVFENCDSLTSVTIPDSVTTIGYEAFRECSSLTSVTIPDSVTTIGWYAFAICESLTSVTIGDSVTTIGDSAFWSCDSLTSVTIPDSVTTIGEEAFYDCYSLTRVTIPDSVTTIGERAFGSCYSLTSVYCKATTPPAGGASMFSLATIYVPEGSLREYKMAEYWSEYADYIVGYDFETGEEEIKNVEFNSATLGQTTPGGILVKFADATNTHELNLIFYADEKEALPAGVYKPGYQFDGSLGYNAESYMLVGGVEHKYNAEKNTLATIEVTADGEAYTFKFNDILFGDEYMATGTCSVELSFEKEENPFEATHTATKWLWSGPSNYGNKYAVSGDGFTVDVHFPTSVATESSLATGEYAWKSTTWFSNSDATNFTTRSFKLDGSSNTVPISNGSAKVTASGDTYTIQLTLVHRDSGKKYMIEYIGKLNDAGEQGGGDINPDGSIKLTSFTYLLDATQNGNGHIWEATGKDVDMRVLISANSCTYSSIKTGDYVANGDLTGDGYFQLRSSTYNGIDLGAGTSMKVENSGGQYKISIVASGYTFVYEGTLN